MEKIIIPIIVSGVVSWFVTIYLGNKEKYKYDEKLEKLKETIRENEEKNKSELRIKESEIDTLRNGVLSGITNRQSILYKRQIAAVEKLWSEILSMAPLKALSEYMGRINYDLMIAHINEGKNKAFIDELGKLSQIEIFKEHHPQNSDNIDEIRPFLSQRLYDLWIAYNLSTVIVYTQYESLKSGMDMIPFTNQENILKSIKKALPNKKESMKKLRVENINFILCELEIEILVEIDKILHGLEEDKKNIEQTIANNEYMKDELILGIRPNKESIENMEKTNKIIEELNKKY